MGVYHFTGLGKSPGAVTAGLSYLKHKVGNTAEDGAIIEGVIIFTSLEIVEGKEPANDSKHNEYSQRVVKKSWTQEVKTALDIVVEYLYREIGEGNYYFCTVRVNDFDACFEAVAKAVLRFHSPNQVGKHIWANITGGPNVLNAALMQTAYLSGFISRLYYTFVANLRNDGQYLQPFSENPNEFAYREIYPLKTTFDERYQFVLEELDRFDQENPNEWISSTDLLSRMKSSMPSQFQYITLDTFRRDFLNTMHGVARRGNRAEGQEDANRLSEEGRAILKSLRSPLYRALLRQDSTTADEVKTLIADLPIEKLERKTR